MAFQLDHGIYPLNSNSQGFYLFPMNWFKYGLENGHLSITNKFYNSYQGGLYLAFKDEVKTRNRDEDGVIRDIWYVSQPGTGKAYRAIMLEDLQVFGSPNRLEQFNSLEDMKNWGASAQYETNAELIRLFSGCSVKLEDKVWF